MNSQEEYGLPLTTRSKTSRDVELEMLLQPQLKEEDNNFKMTVSDLLRDYSVKEGAE